MAVVGGRAVSSSADYLLPELSERDEIGDKVQLH